MKDAVVMWESGFTGYRGMTRLMSHLAAICLADLLNKQHRYVRHWVELLPDLTSNSADGAEGG
jgi:hypothetical protein